MQHNFHAAPCPSHGAPDAALCPAAKAIHVTCDVLGVLFAQAALVVQVHAVLRANEFLAKYRCVREAAAGRGGCGGCGSADYP